MTPAQQAQVFAAMACCGACLGALYDLLGVVRRGTAAAADVLFGLCCAAGIILTALGMQCEPFRLYVFAGVACGAALYALTLGAALRALFCRIFGVFGAIAAKKKEKQAEKGRKGRKPDNRGEY